MIFQRLKKRDWIMVAIVGGVVAAYAIADDTGIFGSEPDRVSSGEPGGASHDDVRREETRMATDRDPAPDARGVTRLRPRLVVDPNGWGQPVDVLSVLVPDGWNFESRVVWAGENGFCSADHAGVFWRIASPDGDRAIEVLPAILMSNWIDTFQGRGLDPNGGHCYLGLVQSHQELAERVLIPTLRPGNRIISVEEISEVPAELRAQVEAQNRTTAMEGIRSTAAGTAVLSRTPDGRHDELILVFYVVSDFPSPGYVPGQRLVMTTGPTILRAPAGELEEILPLVAAIAGTVRVNPAWRRAIEELDANISRIIAQGTAERSRIIANSFREIGEIQMSSWQNRMDANWRDTQRFTSAIMGVTQRVDPFTGETVTLDNTGTRYFANTHGEYLIVDAADIDPRQLYPSEDWREMPSATSPR